MLRNIYLYVYLFVMFHFACTDKGYFKSCKKLQLLPLYRLLIKIRQHVSVNKRTSKLNKVPTSILEASVHVNRGFKLFRDFTVCVYVLRLIRVQDNMARGNVCSSEFNSRNSTILLRLWLKCYKFNETCSCSHFGPFYLWFGSGIVRRRTYAVFFYFSLSLRSSHLHCSRQWQARASVQVAPTHR